MNLRRLNGSTFPHLRILARAEGRYEAYEPTEGGLEEVYSDTLDSSLPLGIDALRLLDVRAYHAFRSDRTFHRHEPKSVHELALMRPDRKPYINTARQRIGDLEELLLSYLEGFDEMVDIGWDAESLRKEYGASGQEVGAGS